MDLSPFHGKKVKKLLHITAERLELQNDNFSSLFYPHLKIELLTCNFSNTLFGCS